MINNLLGRLILQGASIIAMVQALLKVVKEGATAIANLIAIITGKEISQGVVDKIRAVCNAIDAVLEKIKGFFIPA